MTTASSSSWGGSPTSFLTRHTCFLFLPSPLCALHRFSLLYQPQSTAFPVVELLVSPGSQHRQWSYDLQLCAGVLRKSPLPRRGMHVQGTPLLLNINMLSNKVLCRLASSAPLLKLTAWVYCIFLCTMYVHWNQTADCSITCLHRQTYVVCVEVYVAPPFMYSRSTWVIYYYCTIHEQLVMVCVYVCFLLQATLANVFQPQFVTCYFGGGGGNQWLSTYVCSTV